MTTNKPEVFEVCRTRQGTLESVVLLADYEALQAELEQWKNGSTIRDEQNEELHQYVLELKTEIEKLRTALAESRANDQQAMAYLSEVRAIVGGDDFPDMVRRCEKLQAENALLRAAIRRLCNLYVVDDYYMGQLREERLDAAVNRAIEQVKETTMKTNKPDATQLVGDVKYDTALFCDLKTDEEKSTFFLSGRGYETGVIDQAIQNDVAMAYHRCSEYRKELEALQAECEKLSKDAERYWWLRRGGNDDIGVVMGFDGIDCGSTSVAYTYEEGLCGERMDAAIDAAMQEASQ